MSAGPASRSNTANRSASFILRAAGRRSSARSLPRVAANPRTEPNKSATDAFGFIFIRALTGVPFGSGPTRRSPNCPSTNSRPNQSPANSPTAHSPWAATALHRAISTTNRSRFSSRSAFADGSSLTPTLDVLARLRDGAPVIQKTPPTSNARGSSQMISGRR